jgi:mono/diheme cytochrome c family protein
MKKVFILSALSITVFSCSKKISPSKATAVVETAPVTSVDSATVNAAIVATGQKVFVGKCGKCHELKQPAQFTKERWVGIVNWMAPKAKATDEEKAQILAYVQHNAKDAVQ